MKKPHQPPRELTPPESALLAAVLSSEHTPAELARRAGIQRSSLSRFINRTSFLNFITFYRLAPVIGYELKLEKRTP